jgi:hypothetical protein
MKLPPQVRTLMATKPHKYGTRHLTAGDEYEVPPRHAIALVAARKARFADNLPPRIKPVTTPQPKSEPEPAAAAETTNHTIDRLRLQATQLGINVDGRWGVPRLQYEIAQAKR